MAHYNVALLPIYKEKEFISLSANFKHLADRYILGEHSLAHVTLSHFVMESDDLQAIWESLKNILTTKIILNFQAWSYATFNNEIFWIALLPDERQQLEWLHAKVIELLKLIPKRSYDPHLTLINTKESNALMQITNIFTGFTSIQDEFILSLGESDDIGQYQKVLFSNL